MAISLPYITQVPSQLDSRSSSSYDDDARRGAGGCVTLRIFCSYEGGGKVDSLALSVLAPPPLSASQASVAVPCISGGSRTPVIVTVTLRSGGGSLPSSNTVTILGSYTAATGEPRTCRSEVVLPLCLFCQVCVCANGKQWCCRLGRSESGFGRRKCGDIKPYSRLCLSETGTGRAPAGTTKRCSRALVAQRGAMQHPWKSCES